MFSHHDTDTDTSGLTILSAVTCAVPPAGVKRSRLVCIPAVILVLATVATETFQITASPLPPVLESYLTSAVRLIADERQRLIAAGPVTKLLDADESKEVAVFGAMMLRSVVMSRPSRASSGAAASKSRRRSARLRDSRTLPHCVFLRRT